MNPTIEVTPPIAPVDAPFAVALSGFPPHRDVTLLTTVDDPRGRPWSSRVVVRTGADGAADLGADAERLLWSLEPRDAAPRAPFDEFGIAPLVGTLTAEVEASTAAVTRFERRFLAAESRALVLAEDGLVGTLFLPAGEGPFRTVMLLGGSGGGQVFAAQCGALLAGHGFACLALSYFGVSGLPEHLVGIPLEYFERALRWLMGRPFARDEGVAVVGRSKGGELALLLGATFPEVRAVVGYCPSNTVWSGIRNNQMIDASSWTHHDRDVPCVAPRPTAAQQAEIFGTRPISLRPLFDLPVDSAAAAAATIPVERIRGPVVLFSGDDDRMWPAGRMCDAVIERLRAHHHPFASARHRYADAGHLLRAPCMPTAVIDSPMFALGGTPAGQAAANRASWRELLVTLGAEAG